MASAEEHSERNETERGEDSDTEKDPEHKPLDEVANEGSAGEAPDAGAAAGGSQPAEPAATSEDSSKKATALPEEVINGTTGGEDLPPDYGAINPSDIPPFKEITLDELLDSIGFRCYHYVVILVLSIVTVGDVMETEVGILLGPVLLCEWKLTGLQEAMSTSSLYVGALLGSLIWGTIADKYGRKVTLIVVLLWIGVFGFSTSFANTLTPYTILRLVTGVGIGGAYIPVTYATEMVNAKSRSFATLIIFFAAFLGTILASTIAMFTLPSPDGWKWYVIITSIIVLVSCFFVAALVPESPRYLLLTGNHAGVIKVLRKFDSSLDQDTYHHLQAADMAEEKRGSIKELCKYRSRCIQYFVIAFSWFLIKFNAMGVVLLYFERLQDKSLTSNCTENGAIVKTSIMTQSDQCDSLGFDEYMKITIFNLEVGFGAIIAYVAAEFLGRIRGLVLTNSIAIIFALPLVFCMSEIALTIIIMISKSFSAATWYIMSLYINEYFPTYIRSIASGSLDVFGRCGVIITPFVAQYLSKETMFGATCLYLSFMILGLILTWFFKYETKDKEQKDNQSRNTEDIVADMKREPETAPIKSGAPPPPVSSAKPTPAEEATAPTAAANETGAEAPAVTTDETDKDK